MSKKSKRGLDVQEKLALFDEFERSDMTPGEFARKRQVSDSVMRRLIKDVKQGKFANVLATSTCAYSTP